MCSSAQCGNYADWMSCLNVLSLWPFLLKMVFMCMQQRKRACSAYVCVWHRQRKRENSKVTQTKISLEILIPLPHILHVKCDETGLPSLNLSIVIKTIFNSICLSRCAQVPTLVSHLRQQSGGRRSNIVLVNQSIPFPPAGKKDS